MNISYAENPHIDYDAILDSPFHLGQDGLPSKDSSDRSETSQPEHALSVPNPILQRFMDLSCEKENLRIAHSFPTKEKLQEIAKTSFNAPYCKQSNTSSHLLANTAKQWCTSDKKLARSILSGDMAGLKKAVGELNVIYSGDTQKTSGLLELPPTLLDDGRNSIKEDIMERFDIIQTGLYSLGAIQGGYTFTQIIPKHKHVECRRSNPSWKYAFWEQYQKWVNITSKRNFALRGWSSEDVPPSVAILLQKTDTYKEHGEYLLELHKTFLDFRTFTMKDIYDLSDIF